MARIGTSSNGGNVNIQDSSGNPLNSTMGALNVNVVSSGSSGTSINLYNEVTGVAMNASSSVLTYTVPPTNTLTLNRVQVSSDSISTVEIDLDSSPSAKGRICYTNYNLNFGYDNLSLPAGTIITVTAVNNSLQGSASFNATLQGVLQ